MMRCLLVLALVFSARAQDDLDSAIKSVFGTGNGTARVDEGDFLSNLGDIVSSSTQGYLEAIEKCGEGKDQGKRACVPYFNCDGQTRTIITDGQTDGFGIIDIRGGEESLCDHYMDVCCKIPDTGLPPTITTEKPVVNPKEPVINTTIPPITPGRGNFCGIRNPNGIDFKIAGNKNNEAEYGEFPWMIEILKRNYDSSLDESFAICGGALITPIVVLTGAHCVNKFKVDDIKIRAGEWDTQTMRERVPYQERNVVDIVLHKDFHEKTLYNNVALLILSEPLVKADNLGTICLPPTGQTFDSKNCFATGWGKDVFGQEGVYQVILKKIELPIVPHSDCQNALRTTRLGKFFNLHESFICAGGEAGKDACTGDGGGPLVCPDPNNPKRYVQAGIVSWGIGCGEDKIPGVYTDVAKYRDWIDREMAKQNLDTKPYTI